MLVLQYVTQEKKISKVLLEDLKKKRYFFVV